MRWAEHDGGGLSQMSSVSVRGSKGGVGLGKEGVKPVREERKMVS